MHELCDVCNQGIVRDYLRPAYDAFPVAEWLGVCGCVNRKWRWRSVNGNAPWELIGDVEE